MLSVHDLITQRASGTQMSNGSTCNSIAGLPKLAAAFVAGTNRAAAWHTAPSWKKIKSQKSFQNQFIL